MLTGIVFGQTQITGLVTSAEDGEPMIGVNVVVKGTTIGAVTNLEGEYTITVPEATEILVFSFIGMKTMDIPIEGRSIINVVLELDVLGLDEVVVVGYGTQRKSDLTGSIVTIGSEDYEEQPVNRIDQILQGRTAGVNVTNSSGAPGGELSIRIRGANSINGSNNPLVVVDGFVGADFRDVNPTDIESIQVLKDASSTAIYGSRGANGVILITTKGGKVGKPTISFTARYFTSQVLKKYDLMDAATFAETANARANQVGSAPPFTSEQINGFRANGGTDWQDEIFRTALGQEYQVDYTGGTEKIGYYVSGNYLNREGTLINSYYKRYSLRTNVDAKITDWLEASLKVNFIRRVNNNTAGDGRTDGPIGGALAWAPTTPARDANGQLTINDPVSSIKSNPIELAQDDRIVENNTFNTNGGFLFKIIDGLTLNVGYGISYINAQSKNFNAGRLSNSPDATRRSDESIFLQNTNTLTYDKIFKGIHRLTLTGVVEHQSFQTDWFSSTATGLQFPDFRYDNITLAGGVSSQAYKQKQTIQSFIGRVNYSLLDKYLVTASVRADGSSKFRGDNRFSNFPSVGVGWRLSEEAFMQNMSFINNLKLRASWGQTGSQGIPVYGTVTTFYTDDYQAGTSFANGSFTPGIKIGNPGNPDLKWETTTQFNIGFDVAIMESRLGLEFDYFQKNTTDLLISEPLPEYSGGGSIFRNLGEVKNNGVEINLIGRLASTSEFSWYSTLNATFLKNEVTNIGDRERIFLDGDSGAGLTNLPENVLIPGYGLSNFWGLKYLGTWKSSEASEAAVYGNVPGDSRYDDLNGDGAIGGDDYQIIGSGIPETLLGWNNTFNYKSFTLNIFFQAMMGYDKWNFAYAQSVMAVADAREVTHSDITKRWTESNETDIPHFSQSDLVEIQSSRFIQKGDFLRLKNLSLTYNLPQDLIPGVNGSLTIGALNLLTFTKYEGVDPEAYSNRGSNSDARGADAGAYPNAKTWTLGINLKF
jgi:TonB-linked SusC/RagA family outer membrane protein